MGGCRFCRNTNWNGVAGSIDFPECHLCPPQAPCFDFDNSKPPPTPAGAPSPGPDSSAACTLAFQYPPILDRESLLQDISQSLDLPDASRLSYAGTRTFEVYFFIAQKLTQSFL